MKSTNEDLLEIACIAAIIAIFCLTTDSPWLRNWQIPKPSLRYRFNGSPNLTFTPWNR